MTLPPQKPGEDLPFEDRAAGHYVNRPHKGIPGAKVLHVETEDEDSWYVSADDFMAVQKERDDLRRTMSMLNASLRRPGYAIDHAIDRLLREHDMTPELAEATRGIIAEFTR